jgi:hypothetical protein
VQGGVDVELVQLAGGVLGGLFEVFELVRVGELFEVQGLAVVGVCEAG